MFLVPVVNPENRGKSYQNALDEEGASGDKHILEHASLKIIFCDVIRWSPQLNFYAMP